MSEASTSGSGSHSEDSNTNSSLNAVLKSCAKIQSLESLGPPIDYDYNDVYLASEAKMISPNPYSFSGNISNSSYASDDPSISILEDHGRISLAYENLNSIPRRLADKFAGQTKCLDLSHNDFRNLQFLSFFEDLHTLILDRNVNLDLNTLPYLPSLNILWINNCDISNITDWIHRIERQCPFLEQLACMGNPGIRNVFGKESGASYAARDYILQVLPNLKYLNSECVGRDIGSGSQSRNTVSSSQGQIIDSASNSEKLPTGCKSLTPTLGFRQLFRFKQHKKTHNSIGKSYGNCSSTN
ncbi:leucine-rich melanocyte differentiation-associated protein isoform X1 [Drosophila tropicalis]|uniref:leucine-rich melanocyte differentiation-associated protein isoform X1 n=1 Tax=Drosophila tropicalis TaxID=46794 RepID=UPI0035AB7AB2